MTTAEALEGITDPGSFEILATRVLRLTEPTCQAIAHMGVNAQGKTIPNPVDGFCRVPNIKPPLYVMSAFTTCAASDLKEKWLNDNPGRPDGDLVKAIREAQSIRYQDANCSFELHLVTNRMVKKELIEQCEQAAAPHGVTLRFLELSRLRDFLDVNPDGQYLRQVHLGIQAERLSAELLAKLGEQSLAEYECQMLLVTQAKRIETENARAAWNDFETSPQPLHVLVGASGAGKTVIAHDVMKRHIEQGGFALWLPSYILETAASLPEAVNAAIRSLHPNALPDSGHVALQLAVAERPLILVVDDVNRSSSPVGLIAKLVNWARGLASSHDSGVRRPRIHLLCPVWEMYWLSQRDRFVRVQWVVERPVGPLNRHESIECLRSGLGIANFSEAELNECADLLQDDAILLGLFARQCDMAPTANRATLAVDAIGHFIRSSLGELAASSQQPQTDFEGALGDLSLGMVRRRNLYPAWGVARSWLSPYSADALAKVAANGHVCRVATRETIATFEFRHDRILDYQLRGAFASMLESGEAQIAFDAFFMPYLAGALASREWPESILDWVENDAPVALALSLRYFPGSPSAYSRNLGGRLRRFLLNNEAAYEERRHDALQCLTAIQSPIVLEATRGIEERRVWAARLRNGDALAGAMLLAESFYPAMKYPWLEKLLEEAALRHETALIETLRELLSSSGISDDVRFGALCLAGYVGRTELGPAVAASVNVEGVELIKSALWAALRCESPVSITNQLIASLAAIPADHNANGSSERSSAIEELSFALKRGIPSAQMTFLLDLASDEHYKWIILLLVEKIDHPATVTFTASSLARHRFEAEAKGQFDVYADQWLSRGMWGDHLSTASLEEIRGIWTTATEPPWLRQYALDVWVRRQARVDIALLGLIESDDPIFDRALGYRAQAGDPTAVQALLDRIAHGQTQWLEIIRRVWNSDVASAVATMLSDPERAKYVPSRLLMAAPAADVECILLERWEGLKNEPKFVQVALYLGSDRAVAAADQVIQSATPSASAAIFRSLSQRFGFRDIDMRDYISFRHIEVLAKYLEKIDDYTLWNMTDFCNQRGYRVWAIQNLQPECLRRTTERPKYRNPLPLDEELMRELDDIESDATLQGTTDHWHWTEGFSQRRDPAGRMFAVLEAWLHRSCNAARFAIAASIVGEHGSRADLGFLETALHSFPAGQDSFDRLQNVQYQVMRRSLT